MVALGSPQTQAAGNGLRGAGVGHSLGIGRTLVVSFTTTQNEGPLAQALELRSFESFQTAPRGKCTTVFATVPARQIVNAAHSDRRAERIRVSAQTADGRECAE